MASPAADNLYLGMIKESEIGMFPFTVVLIKNNT